MQCFIAHSNYKQFEQVYGDKGVNLVYSSLLDIPNVEEVKNLPDSLQNLLQEYKIDKTKKDIRSNLKSIFGDDLSDNQINFVTDLGSSIARFKKDGSIVFNSLKIQNNGVEYHEAFHRIFRMYLSEEERQEIINEVKKQNSNKPWSRYDRKTEDEQIEELIADDFKLSTELVQHIMTFMVEIGLFENTKGE